MSINENNSIDLMGIPKNTGSCLTLDNAAGYNNGIYLLNNICNTLYSNTDLNANARNINMGDIRSKMNETGTSAIESYSYSDIQYGTLGKIAEGYYYPVLNEYENGSGINKDEIEQDIIRQNGIDSSNDGTQLNEIKIPLESNDEGIAYKKIESGSHLAIKQNYFSIENKEEYYDDKNFYDLISERSGDYWIATRTQYCNSGRTGGFGMQVLKSDGAFGHSLLMKSSNTRNWEETGYYLRPIVTLDSSIKIVRQRNGTYIPQK